MHDFAKKSEVFCQFRHMGSMIQFLITHMHIWCNEIGEVSNGMCEGQNGVTLIF